MKKYKNRIILGLIIAFVLALTYWWGGDSPSSGGQNPPNSGSDITDTNTAMQITASESLPENAPDSANEISAAESVGEVQTAVGTASAEASAAEAGGKQSASSEAQTAEAILQNLPSPVEPEDAVISDNSLSCALSISCNTIKNNLSMLDPEKTELVPENGIIYSNPEVTFYEGESVFNVLLRELKKNKIHVEFKNTPIYNSAYIEGIGNLYEFDCGELSGWMYKVNGIFPNYGCSRYQLQNGDIVEWIYTCDLGADIGGNYSSQKGE